MRHGPETKSLPRHGAAAQHRRKGERAGSSGAYARSASSRKQLAASGAGLAQPADLEHRPFRLEAAGGGNGAVTLDVEGSVVHVGLPILADVQTLPVAIELRSGGFAQGRVKNVNKVWLRVYRSSGIFTGPSLDMLVEAKQRTTEPWGSPPRLKTEEVEVVNKAAWTDSASVFIRQADPLPLTISSISLEVAIGG